MAQKQTQIKFLEQFSPRMQIVLWVAAHILLIPILFVLITPEGGSIVLAFLSFVFLEKVGALFTKGEPAESVSTVLKIGSVCVLAFVVTTAVLIPLFIPICHWLEVQETLEVRFLNFEPIYGLSLCYAGTVDFVSLGFGAFVAYLLIPTFYLLLPFRLIYRLARRFY